MIPFIILAIENEDDRDFVIRLYMEHRALLYSRIISIVKNPQDAEDVMQDVMEKVIDKLDALRCFDPDTLRAYLAETAKNRALNFLETPARKKTVYTADFARQSTENEDVDELLIDRMWIDKLHLVWPTLKEETRSILEMRYFLAMSDEEIARSFGIRPDSVRMRLTRARREAKQALEKIS